MDYIIKSNNLSFKDIVKYPAINIEKGKTTFITGQSGCGKSTLLKLFNACLSQTSGEIYYNNESTEKINPVELRREILLVSQNTFLFDDTIKSNFNEFYNIRGLQNPSNQTIQKFLDICCIDFPLDYICTNMSGGERQRVFIAICLSLLPKVLMLDEPTSALDEKTSDIIIGNIKDFCIEKSMTLICVSHNPQLTQKYADAVINLTKEDNNEQ